MNAHHPSDNPSGEASGRTQAQRRLGGPLIECHTQHMLFGVVLVLAGTVVLARQTRRLADANPHSRLPYIGWPPNRPSYSKTLTVVGVVLTSAGANFTVRYAANEISMGVVLVCWILAIGVGVLLPQVTHNHGLHR
jgi:hypothetical protein